jgi:hypothetical protein
MILESQLRKLIREILLTEQAGPGKSMTLIGRITEINRDLELLGYKLGLQIEKTPKTTTVLFVAKSTKSNLMSRRLNMQSEAEDLAERLMIAPSLTDGAREKIEKLATLIPWGAIEIRLSPEKNCRTKKSGRKPWAVSYTFPTLKGWGPLLYDLAIEWATINGGGLMSDRLSVSDDALRVWLAYDSMRPDVKMNQLDVEKSIADENQLDQRTPDVVWDDCTQFSALDHMPGDWEGSLLSRVATKDPVATEELNRLGILW